MDLEEVKAFEKYGHFNSTHEVYGVLIEEVQEFFEVVREKPPKTNEQYLSKQSRLIEELNQIRAISTRAIKEIKQHQIKHI